MNTKHLISNFISPSLFYMAVVLYFISGMSVLASLGKDPGFLVLGFITFVLGYNSWYFANKAKESL